jgi:hypothetical protein
MVCPNVRRENLVFDTRRFYYLEHDQSTDDHLQDSNGGFHYEAKDSGGLGGSASSQRRGSSKEQSTCVRRLLCRGGE